ncbi:dihydroorotase [Aquirufa aurantiipilula]|uniref:Dihydroorotase n=1 Tax=Aquirufa aurantiipilula TaxID=2696561 RepID=A0ABT6BHE0_9BACT|nr:dihydroorotase [Aquirufa aurantiipilula]MDF5689872.1 dihydroorotase [Aquirufa aurantiipilula]
MRILFKSVLILDSTSTYFQQKVDLLAENGIWKELAPSITSSVDSQVDCENLSWYPSVIDLRVHHTLPGGEFKEDWNSLKSAAIRGGVLDMALLPTGNPVPQQAEAVQFIANQTTEVSFYPIAPLTLDNKGENFTDLYDLHQAGAEWFSHGAGSLQNTDLMVKCLQYLQTLPVTLVTRPNTEGLSLYGQIHEGLQSTLMGLKGIPVLAETLSIKRDLDLLRYVQSNSFGNGNKEFKLHISCLSCQESVNLIRQAKKEGLPVSADVAIHQLIFTESDVADFDTNKKVNPPFRTQEDQDALWKGLVDGTIDAIVSDHHPVEVEMKEIEFDQASFGVVGLETLLPALLQAAKLRNIQSVDTWIHHGPAKLLGIDSAQLAVGNPSKGVLVALKNQEYEASQIVSKSKNSAFLNHTFDHQIVGVLNGTFYTSF